MRFLQIADVVNSMTDLMHMSQDGLSPMTALQQLQMGGTNSHQEQSPESLHSMPTVTSVAPHTSPSNTQQHRQPQQMPSDQHNCFRSYANGHRQPQHMSSDQHNGFRADANGHLHRGATAGQNRVNICALPVMVPQGQGSGSLPDQLAQQTPMISPCHSNGSGVNPFARPPTSLGRTASQNAKRS